jgi:hypothetical protein
MEIGYAQSSFEDAETEYNRLVAERDWVNKQFEMFTANQDLFNQGQMA